MEMADGKQTQILLINDMAGYGKVALSAMIPVLSHLKYEIFNLPTALVSNTLDYGRFDILDTSEYMQHTLQIWEEFLFHLMQSVQVLLFRKSNLLWCINIVKNNKKRGL